MPKYISLDPGDTTGWASFDEKGNSIEYGEVKGRPAITELLSEQHPEVVICEDWITRGHTTFGGDKMNTVRAIGRIEEWCETNNAKLVMQPNTVKPIAYMWAGMKKPKNHAISHGPDAYVHGVYYLQKNGIRKPQQGRAVVE